MDPKKPDQTPAPNSGAANLDKQKPPAAKDFRETTSLADRADDKDDAPLKEGELRG